MDSTTTVLLIILIYIVLIGGFVIFLLKGIWEKMYMIIKQRIKGIHQLSLDEIIDAIKNGDVKYEKEFVEFYANVVRRSLHDSVMIFREDDCRWFVKTHETRTDGHKWYHVDKVYRFKLYISDICYDADDNQYTIWSTVIH